MCVHFSWACAVSDKRRGNRDGHAIGQEHAILLHNRRRRRSTTRRRRTRRERRGMRKVWRGSRRMEENFEKPSLYHTFEKLKSS